MWRTQTEVSWPLPSQELLILTLSQQVFLHCAINEFHLSRCKANGKGKEKKSIEQLTKSCLQSFPWMKSSQTVYVATLQSCHHLIVLGYTNIPKVLFTHSKTMSLGYVVFHILGFSLTLADLASQPQKLRS